MNRRTLIAMVALLAVAAPVTKLLAHDDEAHAAVAGTVESLKDDDLKVATSDGKATAIRLTAETRYAGPKGAASRADLKPGVRVHVSTTKSGQTLMAKEVKVEASEVVYTCPMHPEVQQSGPGKCPKCGMNLEPKKG